MKSKAIKSPLPKQVKSKTLQKAKADSPPTPKKPKSNYSVVWSEMDADDNIIEKSKSFDTPEAFSKFKAELVNKSNFLQIVRQTKPNNMKTLPAPKSEKMEKVSVREVKEIISSVINEEISKLKELKKGKYILYNYDDIPLPIDIVKISGGEVTFESWYAPGNKHEWEEKFIGTEMEGLVYDPFEGWFNIKDIEKVDNKKIYLKNH